MNYNYSKIVFLQSDNDFSFYKVFFFNKVGKFNGHTWQTLSHSKVCWILVYLFKISVKKNNKVLMYGFLNKKIGHFFSENL